MQAFPYRDGELYCEDVPVAKLAEQYGTPLWVYSKSFILGQLKKIQTAFAEVDPVICYSVKANSTLGIRAKSYLPASGKPMRKSASRWRTTF